jgi:putative transposase
MVGVARPTTSTQRQHNDHQQKHYGIDGLAEKGGDVDLVREMIRHVAQRMMDMDVENLCAATYGERSADRANSRNGFRERTWDTRAGTMDLKIPKLRKGSYF